MNTSKTQLPDSSYSPQILLVDDNVITLETSRLVFSYFQLTPDTAANGAQAIECCRRKHYDLIFMDLVMPEFNGIETAEYIFHHYQLHSIETLPVILALSAENTPSVIEACLRTGMSDFLSKPINPNAVRKVLEKYVSNFPLPGPSPRTCTSSDFPQIKGIDIPSARICTLNDTEAFLNLLYSFQLYGQTMLPDLAALWENARYHDFLICIHGMKGSLASIGALDLSNKAKELETSIRDTDYENAVHKFHDFLDGYRELLSQINIYLSKRIPMPIHRLSADEVTNLLSRLSDALQSYEIDAADRILSSLYSSFCPEYPCLPSAMKQIYNHLKMCRYKETIRICQTFFSHKENPVES